MAVTGLAVSFRYSQGVAIVPRQAAVTIESSCVVNAFEAFTRCSVTVGHSIGVDVVVAFTFLARYLGPEISLWVAIVPVETQIASPPYKHGGMEKVALLCLLSAVACSVHPLLSTLLGATRLSPQCAMAMHTIKRNYKSLN